MNFSPFTQFSGLQSSSSLHQFTTAKFAQNLSASNGQVGNMFFFKEIMALLTKCYLKKIQTIKWMLKRFFKFVI